MLWVSPLVWPLTLSRPLRSRVWENAALCLAMTPVVWEFSLGVCCLCGVLRCTGVQRNMVVRRVCAQCLRGGGILFLFLVARETCSACVCSCTRQTMAALLSILSERPRWRFPPSANKGPGHPACLSPPSFPSIPPQLTSPQCRKLRASPHFSPCLSPWAPPPTPQLSWYSTFISQWRGTHNFPLFFKPLSFGFPFGQ